MKIVLLDPALQEFSAAVDFYNSESPGLGFEFADEIFHTIARIEAMHGAWQQLSVRTRRCITRRFPYGIVYEQRKNELIIVSIMHLRRNPETWKSLLK